jgi:uncharacterized protein (TIGR02001 family)
VALGGLKGRLLAGASLLIVAGPAMAADLSSGGSMKDAPAVADALAITGYVDATNDYIFRGVSQNRRDVTMQAGFDAAYKMFYVGTFTSGVDFDLKSGTPGYNSSQEVDLYAGIKPTLGLVTLDLGVITYNYLGTNLRPGFYDPFYYELKAGASITVLKDLALSGTIFYSPNYFAETGPALTFEGTASKPIAKIGGVDVAASGTIGYTTYSDATAHGAPNYDYTYGNVGLTGTVGALSLDLRWWDTDLPKNVCDASALQCGSAFAGTLKLSF